MAKKQQSYVNKVVKGQIVPKSRPDIPGVNSGAGGRASQCSSCKEVFGGLTAFDLHRKTAGYGDNYYRICLNPEDVGLELGERNVWISETNRFDEDETP